MVAIIHAVLIAALTTVVFGQPGRLPRISTDGQCGPSSGTTCPNNSCCSESGQCGLSSEYCGTGCQKPFGACWETTVSPVLGGERAVSINDRCGPGFETRCPGNKCCSQGKLCGTDDGHCQNGCLFGYGLCLEVSSPTTLPNGLTIVPRQCGPDIGVKCAGSSCCSKDGKCGNDGNHCNENCLEGYGTCWDYGVPLGLSAGFSYTKNGQCGKEFGTKCNPGHCCSKDGKCGSGKGYCEAGCQKGYGRCWKYSPPTYAVGEAPRNANNKCGQDLGGNGKCKNDQCCSRSQYCGASLYYCGVGCIPQFGTCLGTTPSDDGPFPSTDGQCGSDINTKCPNGGCCSKNGVCGTTSGYCGKNCQEGYGVCWGPNGLPKSPPPPKSPLAKLPPPVESPSTKLKDGYPISVNNRCGKMFGTRCPDALCCSGNEFCGKTLFHCGKDCQKDFGVCWDTTQLLESLPPVESGLPPAESESPSPAKSSTPVEPSPEPKSGHPVSKDNRCGKVFGTKCPDTLCCSGDHFCGKTKGHCKENCQKDYGVCWDTNKPPKSPAKPKAPAPKPDYPVSADGQCGKEFGTRCSDTLCCSRSGLCGDTDPHCGKGCQEGYGICWGDIELTELPVQPPPAKLPPANSKVDYITSTDGLCGKKFGLNCSGRDCCSKSGFCGESPGYCGKGCQKDYGVCWDGDEPPKPPKPPPKPPAKLPPANSKSGRPVSVNNQCGWILGTQCSGKDCCSGNGFCGDTVGYCGKGCQEGYGVCWDGDEPPKPPAKPTVEYPISADGLCGDEVGTKCPGKECCSKSGFCGKTVGYCGKGCQESYGVCWDGEPPKPKVEYPVSADGRCGEGFDTRCPGKECCSKSGFCGKTVGYCRDGCQKDYGVCWNDEPPRLPSKPTVEYLISADGRCGEGFSTKCPGKTCCSGSGFCGKTPSHCGIGCQKDFGFCLTPEALARFLAKSTTTQSPSTTTQSSAQPKAPASAPKTDYPISKNNRCGEGFNTKCPGRTCCSGSGFCGKTKSHCGKGCQKNYGFCLKPEALARLKGEL
ncbi:hypothetical protein BATDEDRAFT_27702 [Batrachochytrium dendrobatidis JAM81]|uniref:Chitin-binding type-1 domain-containing protein n=1 Tax=Batrachochytrium dendrobatidis (strain JAM81 / FGSC 10211) TaxID=684364 RepID=F4PBN7_BATDJ|nr:uncharacterized protein BATDEDRAFT_27702 [Batrachochytrium dendrobatidis JAM81]EGF77476.1 hypothetical protein BATDEDRAFT_27702 [Batrachochytrium dendrobatidis JAM81]|eukprot:XP_006681942.1 hypothetical protein BATDEDRAFT_27702 [Batrachochytrium dendrobatidis JAM81]